MVERAYPNPYARVFLAILICWCQWLVSAQVVVQDTGPGGPTFDSTWVLDENGDNSGGLAHRTSQNGGTATFTFTGELMLLYCGKIFKTRTERILFLAHLAGTTIGMYGVTHNDGAQFTFTIDGTYTQDCTCYVDNGVWFFGVRVCYVSGLGATSHKLVVTHADSDGLWLNLDFLEIAGGILQRNILDADIFPRYTPSVDTSTSSPPANTHTTSSPPPSSRTTSTTTSSKISDTTTSSTITKTTTSSSAAALSTGTSTSSTSQSSTLSPSTSATNSPPHAPGKSSNIAAIAGGTAAGVCGLAIIVTIVILLFRRRSQRRARDSPLYGPSSALYRPPSSLYADTQIQGSERSSSLYPLRTNSAAPQLTEPPVFQNGYSGYSEPYEASPQMSNLSTQLWGPHAVGASPLGTAAVIQGSDRSDS
ncbi:hypothetical protein DL93DRAFT_2102971 [Clavulina sp. PMI_390]|nr:hypothetical protein DL93DRAFT_2102971 [Clavulina sp. PMI_390]